MGSQRGKKRLRRKINNIYSPSLCGVRVANKQGPKLNNINHSSSPWGARGTTMNKKELKEFLDLKVELYNNHDFIETDPIQVPHKFTLKQDIEIAGLFVATIAWGKRTTIINNALKLMEWMDYSPFQFIINHKMKDLKPFEKFVHRTFNGNDCIYFIEALNKIYQHNNSLENLFTGFDSTKDAITNFRMEFLKLPHQKRLEKHISNPLSNSASKRLNMYLRWMVRKDKNGVDFGIWNSISMSQLMLPLDVHTSNVGRKIGLLERKQNDWKAVEEITTNLLQFDNNDPVKYDYALFGLGINENF